MDVRKKIMDNVCQAKTFLILTHVRPDGDAISSSIAMYYLLVSLGKDPKNIEVFIPYISKDLSFIDKHNILTKNCTMNNHDLVIIVDCSDYSRVEVSNLLREFSSQQCIIIDHHEVSGNLMGTENYIIDTSATSCTCIIYREFHMYMCEQNSNSFLRCVAIGIMSDTIGLTLNVTDECRDILSYCKKVGVDIQNIKEQLRNVDVRTQILASLTIKRLIINQGIGCTYILQSDLNPEEYNLKTVNHKAIIQQILDMVPCNTLVLLIENENHEIKGSMRTTLSNVNLNYICALMVERKIFLQGGGHSNSAGFKMTISDTTETTLNHIFKLLVTAILGN